MFNDTPSKLYLHYVQPTCHKRRVYYFVCGLSVFLENKSICTSKKMLGKYISSETRFSLAYGYFEFVLKFTMILPLLILTLESLFIILKN